MTLQKRKIKTWPFKLLLGLTFFVCVERFCHKKTKGFRPHKIYSHLSYDPRWESIKPSSEEREKIDKILSQKFYYLGDGGQCYAFVSQDQTVVLKLFKHHHLRPNPIIQMVPAPFFVSALKDKYIRKQNQKLEKIFLSCKIAFEELKEETGLIYLHLNKSQDLKKQLTLVDKIGIAHKIDLDKTEFLLQHKAENAFRKLKKEIRYTPEEIIKARINQYFNLLLKSCKKGIKDKDLGLKRNFGFVGNQLIEIDIGSFYWDKKLSDVEKVKKELLRKSKRLFRILKKKSPILFEHFQTKIMNLSNEDLAKEKYF